MAVGFVFGLVSFFRGFKVYREYRVVEDTPQEPLRSLAMGLVNVQGEASGPEQLTSPVSGTSCYYYRVDIQKWHSDGHGGHWSHYHTDAGGVRFQLTDPSGSVWVDASGAELDLTPCCERRARNTALFGMGGATGELELLNYITRAGGGLSTVSLETGAATAVGEMTLVHGSFRLKELCIVPGRRYTITGTCTENPKAKDEHDRNLILKGVNESTYLISEKPLAALESSLRVRVALMVLGGAALAVVCLALLLVRFHLW
jgi:E3 Ubiquitin ligase